MAVAAVEGLEGTLAATRSAASAQETELHHQIRDLQAREKQPNSPAAPTVSGGELSAQVHQTLSSDPVFCRRWALTRGPCFDRIDWRWPPLAATTPSLTGWRATAPAWPAWRPRRGFDHALALQ